MKSSNVCKLDIAIILFVLFFVLQVKMDLFHREVFFVDYYARAEFYYFFAPLKGKREPRQLITLDQIKQSINDCCIKDIDMILIKVNKKTKKMFVSSQNFTIDVDGNQIKIDNVMKHVINNDKIRYHNFRFFPYLLINDSISHLKGSIKQCN